MARENEVIQQTSIGVSQGITQCPLKCAASFSVANFAQRGSYLGSSLTGILNLLLFLKIQQMFKSHSDSQTLKLKIIDLRDEYNTDPLSFWLSRINVSNI